MTKTLYIAHNLYKILPSSYKKKVYHVEVVLLLVIKDIIVASIFYNLCTYYCLYIIYLLFTSYIALFQGIILHKKFEEFG